MLRTAAFRLLRTANIRTNRPISTSLWCSSSQNIRKSSSNVDELFTKDRPLIEPLIEDPIIVKKFFVSEVDSEQMLYPEVISRDELDSLIKINQDVSEFFATKIEFDGKGITKSIHDTFKESGLYGYNVPKEYGGRGFIYTELMLASEAEAEQISAAMILNAHRLVCESINEFGTVEQRSKYLPQLAKGDLVATTAFQEWNKGDVVAERTTAEYDADKNQWRLNGTKSFVVNAAKANLIMVSANVPQSSKTDSLTMFLIDANAPGVSVQKKDTTIGHRDLYQAEVSFKDVYLSSDAMLSTPGSGRHIERTTMFLSRVQHSILNLAKIKAINKYMLNMVEAVEQQNRTKNPDGKSFEANALRIEISKGASGAYSVESMIYMTIGLMDLYKNTNIDVETAILKNYSQDMLLATAVSLSSFVDTPATVEEHPANEFIRDALQLQTFGEPKDILKLYIGIAGIQHAGDRIYEDVRKKRNPFFNPEYAIGRFFKEESMEKYESNLQLLEHVVREFDIVAGWLEASIQRLRIGSSILMETHGRNLFARHNEIQRLAETVTYIYASFACLVRANRSWILKLPEAEHERVLAGCCCDMHSKSVKELMQHIEDGPLDPLDEHYQTIAKQVIKKKSYFPVHPLTRFI